MNHDEFRDLVAAMRSAQNDYFLRRSPERLRIARDLERRVDKALKPEPAPTPGLFDRLDDGRTPDPRA